MESPLDVLSRAASLVETSNSSEVQDPQYKGPAPPPPGPRDCRESPCKELPTKIHKQERIKERLELSQPLNFDKDHALKHSRKCAGTQTQLSNVSHDMYINGDGKTTSVESYNVRHSLLTRTVSSPSSNHANSPPRYHHDVHDAPLNLSLSSSASHSSADSPTQSRPSVITCASTKSNGSRFENGPHSPSRREVSSVDVCDPAIEEHFRRSLGRNYPEYLACKSSHQSPPPISTLLASSATSNSKISTTNVTITESVDDHFAKSLGSSTWSAIKARNDPAQDLLPGSVDDHFAKALGDTWLRIKAEKEGRGVGGLPLPPPYPHSHPLSHPHQHSSSHSHPPRPSSPQSQKVGSSLVST
ncbi:hypothetical protein ACJMK2_016077 [Sinanodonta woodiana]|uniref:Transcription cofactor vestigial-like protein 4 n=1 Tax=Sinanodonta woodiana TaxID=1069815 RepID=A0ABD3UW53_SINWO